MSSSKYDLAIVGAGPAGAALAIRSARSGLRVVVIDSAEFPRQKVCGEYLAPAAWTLLEQLGLDELRTLARPLPVLRLAVDDATSVVTSFPDDREAPRALSRHTLDARLVRAARDAGAEVLCGRRVRRIIVEEGRARSVECADLSERGAGVRIAAKLIVAADGRRSVVVRDTGRVVRRDLGLIGFKRHVHAYATSQAVAEIAMHALPGGYLGTCPTEDGALNFCGVIPRRLFKAEHGDIAAALRKWLTRYPNLQLASESKADGPWLSMPDVATQRARPTTAGVLYVGDAAGTIEPLTGQGMTMALAGARLASRYIDRFGPDGIKSRVQIEYDAEWNATFGRAIRTADWFGRLLRRPSVLKAMLIAGRPVAPLTEFMFRAARRRTVTIDE